MNAKQIGLSALLLGFTALTAEAVYAHGYVGFFETMLSNLAGVTALVDLVISLSLVMVWIVRDSKETGMSPLPYIALTLALGSVGPLLYLIRREGRVAAGLPRAVRAAA